MAELIKGSYDDDERDNLKTHFLKMVVILKEDEKKPKKD